MKHTYIESGQWSDNEAKNSVNTWKYEHIFYWPVASESSFDGTDLNRLGIYQLKTKLIDNDWMNSEPESELIENCQEK